MNCERIRPLLSAYLDGELDAEGHAQVAAHLDGCQACARALDDWRALGQEIRALPDVPVPAGMRSAFGTRLRGQRVFPVLRMSSLASALSAIVFVIALVVLAVGTSRTLQRMQTLDRTAEVLATYPLDGATDVPLDAKLTLAFARPMDRALVEAAIEIIPAMQLAFAWQEKTVIVVPFNDWQPATAYTLTIATTAQEIEGGALEAPFVLHFKTVGASPTALLTPSPTMPRQASPTPSPTEPPTPTPTGAMTPIGRFGYLWRSELGGPSGSLGLATAEEQELWNAIQPFERGLMIWLDQLQEDYIYLLVYGADEKHGTWQRYADTYREGEPESAGLTPPEGLLEPIRGFGRLWREELGGPDAAIGWALAQEQGYVGAMQPFEHGLMLWNPLSGTTFVLQDDSTWTAYLSSP